MNLTPGALTLDDLKQLHDGLGRLAIDPAAWPAVDAAAAAVQRAAAGDAPVYGVNTGFGKLASTRIGEADLATLQRNLIRSHAVGVGEPLSAPVVRLILVLKAASLARGASGVRREVIGALCAVHDAGLVPRIPAQGSVGASGDLAPLAHLTLALMGEGPVRVHGEIRPAAEALKAAGYATAACVFAGSLVRPFGGAMADRVGGIKTLSYVYILAALLLAAISFAPVSFPVLFPLFFAVMAALGVGNGAVFQLVPQRFRHEVGIMTGLVGFGGGLGGFYLASSLGLAKQWTGSPSLGFLVFAALALVALAGLTSVKKRWRTTWGAAIQGVRI